MARKTLSLLLPLALALAAAAGADTLLTFKAHVEGAPGLPAANRDSDIRVWVAADNKRLRRDERAMSIVLQLDKNKMFMLDNGAKTYTEIDLPIDFKKLMPQGGEQMAEEMSQMAKMSVVVKPTEETRKVGAWSAKKYQVSLSNPGGLKIDTDMWVSQDVGIDSVAFAKMQSSMMSLNPGTAEWVKKMSQIPGFPVLQQSRMTTPGGEIKTTQELVAVDKKPAPAATYQVPSDFTKKDFNFGLPPPGAGRPRPAAPPPPPGAH